MNYLLPKTVYEITGNDALTFLQGQLSNDITQVAKNAVQLNCYMQHQGKIFAILWLVKYKNILHLIVENELAQTIVSRLTMFKLKSDVTITKTNLKVVGSINADGAFILKKNQSINVESAGSSKEYTKDCNDWEIASIQNMIPEIYTTTSEIFIPQVLNLDEDEIGVNFSKGCYVGQEVVARMHYLGKAKRKIYVFTASFAVKVGDELVVQNSHSLRASGVVIRTASYQQGVIFLATLEVKHIQDCVTINDKEITIVT